MNIEVHAPSQILLVVSLGLAVLALIGWFVGSPTIAFWISIMAYVTAAGGTLVKFE
jgi:FtsH-binding integral membrane protein